MGGREKARVAPSSRARCHSQSRAALDFVPPSQEEGTECRTVVETVVRGPGGMFLETLAYSLADTTGSVAFIPLTTRQLRGQAETCLPFRSESGWLALAEIPHACRGSGVRTVQLERQQ